MTGIRHRPLTTIFTTRHPQQWAPNRYAANGALLALLGADYGVSDSPKELREFAQSQIDYILTAGGDINPDTEQPYYSYVIGYGDNFPRAPHHRGSSCGNGWCNCGSGAQPNVLVGAMVGGPDDNDRYNDSCNDYVRSAILLLPIYCKNDFFADRFGCGLIFIVYT